MEIPPVLKKLGLTDLEIKLYTTLLKQKESTASNLVKLTGIQRRGVYDAVERLVKRGLVSYIEQKYKRVYRPVDPKTLLIVLEEKQNQISELEKEIKSILPKLEKFHITSYEKPEVNVFVGKEGVKTVINEIIAKGREIYAISSKDVQEIYKELLSLSAEILVKKAHKLSKVKSIEVDTPENRKLVKLFETRYLPPTQSPPITSLIYENTVVLFRWRDEPLVISIKDSDFAKGFMDYFDTLWRIAKK